MVVQLNPDLRAWSWTPGAFSWIEPTAYALIALKSLVATRQAGPASDRIAEGERLIYDRMCQGEAGITGTLERSGSTSIRILRRQPWP